MADVFGGMGSWNDLDPGDDGLEYQRLPADLFETMKAISPSSWGRVIHKNNGPFFTTANIQSNTLKRN